MTNELERVPRSGWMILFLLALASIGNGYGIYWAIDGMRTAFQEGSHGFWEMGGGRLLLVVLAIPILGLLWAGFFTLQPNSAAALLLLGAYKGTTSRSGFFWANPFYRKVRVSLRIRNLNSEKLKVNDQRGNPVEIAAVVVWRVHDTARALFDVDDFNNYVSIQSESALRHLASSYPYDSADDQTLSLRRSTDEVSRALQVELQERLTKAGVVVEEARLSHLAYAPEIAGTMLRRQQAEQIVAARTRIVEGAVGMVHMALEHLEKDAIVELDAERKAAMVSNLLVVLCGEHPAQPIVNAGTLHN